MPFSVGDVLYGAAAIYLLVKLFRFIKAIVRKKSRQDFLECDLCSWFITAALLVYVVFNIFWGLNYNRMGMAYQMQLQMKPYTTEELDKVMQVIVERGWTAVM